MISLDFLKELIEIRGGEIAVIAVMHSNNETGVIQPVGEVVKLAGEIPVHTDAVQSFTKSPLSYKELGVTSMALSGHKVGGPHGMVRLFCAALMKFPLCCTAVGKSAKFAAAR